MRITVKVFLKTEVLGVAEKCEKLIDIKRKKKLKLVRRFFCFKFEQEIPYEKHIQTPCRQRRTNVQAHIHDA